MKILQLQCCSIEVDVIDKNVSKSLPPQGLSLGSAKYREDQDCLQEPSLKKLDTQAHSFIHIQRPLPDLHETDVKSGSFQSLGSGPPGVTEGREVWYSQLGN